LTTLPATYTPSVHNITCFRSIETYRKSLSSKIFQTAINYEKVINFFLMGGGKESGLAHQVQVPCDWWPQPDVCLTNAAVSWHQNRSETVSIAPATFL